MEEDENTSNDGFGPKSPSAVDFFDINELCEEPDSVPNGIGEHDVLSERELVTRFKAVVESSLPDNSIPGKPLASCLPSRYQDVDVKQIFPSYSEEQALRNLQLFGFGKQSDLPDIWRAVRVKSKKDHVRANVEVKELEVESDEEEKFMRHRVCPASESSAASSGTVGDIDNAWRFGPAKLWYDVADVPETTESYDYGFKIKNEKTDPFSGSEDTTTDEAFFMVTQHSWEDDVIWDGAEVMDKVLENVYSLSKPSGWIPVGQDRTFAAYREHCRLSSQTEPFNRISMGNNRILISNPNKSYLDYRKELKFSIFPEENRKLVEDRWEEDVIWDANAMCRISHPKTVERDSNIIYEIPDDDRPRSPEITEVVKDRKDKKIRPAAKKPEEEEEEDSCLAQNKIDFYNISNDEYYNPKITQETALKLSSGGTLLQHSTPAMQLLPQLFPASMSQLKLRRFHRPTLRTYGHGPFSVVDFHCVESLTNYIKEMELERQHALEESGGGEMFFMHTPSDLTGKDGDVVFFEYSEEFPPLMMQVGMASKIKNYYRRTPGKETSMPSYSYGETAYAHTSPFLGHLQPGQSLQAFENHMFRAPIYEHTLGDTDFLIIRTRYEYCIREVKTVYTVGQQLPLVEVPAPKSEKAASFSRDFMLVFILRMFHQSTTEPRSIKIEDVKKAFPGQREFSIRKKLNMCAEFQRTGSDKCWILKNSFRLPSEEEIRQLVTPEQVCAYYSMLTAEQRLRDAGYGEKNLLMGEVENDAFQNKIDDEIKVAPWNTTNAFLSSVRGKCLLELTGSADPTGCGEGFSYVKIPNKPQWSKFCANGNPSKRLVRGTDADLRRLSLKAAKLVLKQFNVKDSDMKHMTRWEIIHIVRTLSTEQAKLGEGITKFARGNIYSQAEHMRRYKEECQRVFDLQNKVLSSGEVLSSDEEDSESEEDSDLEEKGKYIENILSNNKSMKDISMECEEAARKELQKLVHSDAQMEDKSKAEKPEENPLEGKILRIRRIYQNADGTRYERTETVRRPEVIELYTKIRESKDETFIKRFSLDEAQKEYFRKEKRRLQDQLRRLKRNEMKEHSRQPMKKKMKTETAALKVKCGACGASGHMRTNRDCPFYQNSPSLPPIQVAMTEEQIEAEGKAALDDTNLIKVDETKIILSKKLLKVSDEVRRKSLVLKIPKAAVTNSHRKRMSYDDQAFEYLSTPKGVNRKRIDPVVAISLLFEKLIAELKNLPHSNTQAFWLPVDVKLVPNYYDVIKEPMDLQTMRKKVNDQKYKSREEFLMDVQKMLDNSDIFNGPNSCFSFTAKEMFDHCIKRFGEEEEKYMDLEKAINPLLDDDLVAFNYILTSIVSDHLKAVPESWPFHKPVDKRVTKNYYSVVKKPMDLETLAKNCKAQKYTTRSSFLADVELIYSNCATFNGIGSAYSKTAEQIVNACIASMEMYKSQLSAFEAGIGEADSSNSVSSGGSRHQGKAPAPKKPRSENCNGSVDEEFIDVECMDDAKSSSDKDYNCFDRSDAESEAIKYKGEDSNSCLYSPALQYVAELRSSDSTSPSLPTKSKMQSLLPINGVTRPDVDVEPTNCAAEPYYPVNCDTICDDLMLSDTDSEDDKNDDDSLRF